MASFFLAGFTARIIGRFLWEQKAAYALCAIGLEYAAIVLGNADRRPAYALRHRRNAEALLAWAGVACQAFQRLAQSRVADPVGSGLDVFCGAIGQRHRWVGCMPFDRWRLHLELYFR